MLQNPTARNRPLVLYTLMLQTSELTKAGPTQSATDVHRSNGVCVTIKAKEGNATTVIEAHGATVSGCDRVCAIMQSSDDDQKTFWSLEFPAEVWSEVRKFRP